MLKKIAHSLPPEKLIVYSFVLIISIGTFLLSLPISKRAGTTTEFMSALFTAVSCTCVTGLSLHDTWSYYSVFGQAVMLILVQVGALGLISFTTGLTLMVHRKLGFRDIKIVQEGTQGNIVDIPKILKAVFFSTLAFEILGTTFLSARFIPEFGLLRGFWLSVFLSVSSYCNAGFEITGFICPDSGATPFSNDPFVMIVLSVLTIMGGLGFLTVVDISRYLNNFFKNKKAVGSLSLQTRIVLQTSLWLLIFGTVLLFCFEYDNTLGGFSLPQKISVCFMQSASSRTSGLAPCDLNRQYSMTKFITMVLMFIGASPTSTGGGIKTVSFVVILATMWSTLYGRREVIIKRKKLNHNVVYRSIAICMAFVVLIALSTLTISILEAHKSIFVVDILYEVISAVSTTGFSIGVTRTVSDLSKCILMFLMFIGRIGPVSLILAVTSKKDEGSKMLPEGKLTIS